MPLDILILDDETIVGERLKASLEKDGHSLTTFTDPFNALKSLEEKLFDIVITDIRMDDISGIEILECVRKKNQRTKVIIITGYATLEVARESLTKGAFDFIAKPFKIKEIREAIDKAANALQTEDQG
ncbi:MAG: response regulator [Deltaproteobacteria bacterium]|nr:response regulator [Deltaproteobacteria bacterium]